MVIIQKIGREFKLFFTKVQFVTNECYDSRFAENGNREKREVWSIVLPLI
jgi:hypothetical protein